MTVSSRAKGRASLIGAAVAGLFCFAQVSAPALAEDPVTLFPDQTDATSRQAEDDTGPADGAQDAPGESGPVERDGITVEDLSAVDPDTVGLLDPSNGGFDYAMWHGAAKPDIARLLRHLPTDLTSPALRDLARRLLLTTAELPRNGADRIQEQDGPETLLGLRVVKLLDFGFLDDAIALFEAADGALERDPALAPVLVRAYLLSASPRKACKIIKAQQDNLGDNFWQKRLIYCQLLDDNAPAARFGATLLEDGGVEAPLLYALVDRLTNGTDRALPDRIVPGAFSLALLRLAETALPADFADHDNPAILRATAENPHTGLEIRLKAAEKAALLGAVSTDTLVEIYKSVAFNADELQRPLTLADESYTPRTRALLYQAASVENVPDTKALLIAKSLRLARANGLYPLAVGVHATQVLQMRITGDLWSFADEAARALFAIGRPKPAQAWLEQLHIQAVRDPEAASMEQRLWALARISAKRTPDAAPKEGHREAWAAAIRESTPDNDALAAMRRLHLAYRLIDSLGRDPVPDAAWRALTDMADNRFTNLPNPAFPHLMRKAAAGGKTAEAIVWALRTAGIDSLLRAEPDTVGAVVTALRQVGLSQDALTVALESALINNL